MCEENHLAYTSGRNPKYVTIMVEYTTHLGKRKMSNKHQLVW